MEDSKVIKLQVFYLNKYNNSPKRCKLCNSAFSFEDRKRTVCDLCMDEHRQTSRTKKRSTYKKRNICKCGKEITKVNGKTCSLKCATDAKYDEYIEKWKSGIVDGMKGEDSISNRIRKYLFIKYDNKCSICGWSKINPYTNKIPLEVEHIDGNHKNNIEDNLILICPCCHSLTATYRALNKGQGRLGRKKYSN